MTLHMWSHLFQDGSVIVYNITCIWPVFHEANKLYMYDACFVLDQHTELDFDSGNSLKQQPEVRHITSLGNIIPTPSQQVFALTP